MCSTLRRMNDWRGEEVGIVRAADLMGGATAAEEGGGRRGVGPLPRRRALFHPSYPLQG